MTTKPRRKAKPGVSGSVTPQVAGTDDIRARLAWLESRVAQLESRVAGVDPVTGDYI